MPRSGSRRPATEDGLAALKVSAPGERTVIDLRTPDSKLGIRDSTLELPEPADDGIVRADFPAGVYRFEGKTTEGASLRGEARLSHVFPQPAAFEFPRPDQKDVPATALTLRWSVPEGIEFLHHRYRANRLRPTKSGHCCQVRQKPSRYLTGFLRAGEVLQSRDRDRREGRQSVLHRSQLHYREGAMNQRHQRWSHRPEANLDVLPFQERRSLRFLSFISQLRQKARAALAGPAAPIEDIAMLNTIGQTDEARRTGGLIRSPACVPRLRRPPSWRRPGLRLPAEQPQARSKTNRAGNLAAIFCR